MKKEYTAPEVKASEKTTASTNGPSQYSMCGKGQYGMC
jgi:hypothetical protein